MESCVVPVDLHPLAEWAFIRWIHGVITDFEFTWVLSMVNSDYIELAECLINL